MVISLLLATWLLFHYSPVEISLTKFGQPVVLVLNKRFGFGCYPIFLPHLILACCHSLGSLCLMASRTPWFIWLGIVVGNLGAGAVRALLAMWFWLPPLSLLPSVTVHADEYFEDFSLIMYYLCGSWVIQRPLLLLLKNQYFMLIVE